MVIQRIKETPEIDFYSASVAFELELPIVNGLRAGFPSPAGDYLEVTLDLNKELIKNPASTFYGRVKGESMQDAGITEGDIVVIDKALEPKDGATAVCYLDGEFTLKRIKISRGKVYLMPANRNFKPIEITEYNDFIIWGIVTYIIKKI